MAQSATTDANEENDIRWTDAQIRWPEDEVSPGGTSDQKPPNDDDNETNPFDPFADPDPQEIFSFRFVTKKKSAATEPIERVTETDDENENANENANENKNDSIRLEIHGYKTESDQVWESTGLTLWKASKYLCDYMVQHADELRGQRVLELGAGLGLNGVLAHRLFADSVVITDGDSDAMVELRKNIVVNRIQDDNNNNNNNNKDASKHPQNALSAAQLIWGLESSNTFLESIAEASSSSLSSSQFSIIIASDVIYAAIVIDPLWETVRTLLRKPDGEFWMAFAVRKVPVTIEFVLQKAREYGFRYELVDKQSDSDGTGDDDVEGNPETGPVFIYAFRWDAGAEGADGSNTRIEGS